MSTIKVKDLVVNSTVGIDLFKDSESFIQDLSEDELNLQGGGKYPLPTARETIFPIKKYPVPTPPIRDLP
jgi:hypothetical protein